MYIYIYARLLGIAKVLRKVVIFTFISKINKGRVNQHIKYPGVFKISLYGWISGCREVFYLKVQPPDCSNGCFCTFVWQLTFNEWLSRLPLVVITVCSLLTAIHCWMALYWFVLQTTLHMFSSICTLLSKNLFHLLIASKNFSLKILMY